MIFPTTSMAASRNHVLDSLEGIPSLLAPPPGSPSGSEASAMSLQADADIRTLLRALPTKANMEALMMKMEKQHCRDFHGLRSEVNSLDDRLSKEESEVSSPGAVNRAAAPG